MQALGNYDGGRMLFLGLGTGLGSALIADRVIVPLELGQLLYPGGPRLEHVLGRRGLQRLGKKAWRRAARDPAHLLDVFLADYVVLGGGNAKHLTRLPPGTRLGHNQTAFRGGFRLWTLEDGPTLAGDEEHHTPPRSTLQWPTDSSPRGAEPLLVAYRGAARSPGAGGVEAVCPRASGRPHESVRSSPYAAGDAHDAARAGIAGVVPPGPWAPGQRWR